MDGQATLLPSDPEEPDEPDEPDELDDEAVEDFSEDDAELDSEVDLSPPEVDEPAEDELFDVDRLSVL